MLTDLEKQLRDALVVLLFSAVSAKHGMRIASALNDNNWAWPDAAPRFVNPGHEQARTALAAAKEKEASHD